ncbi:MAG: hypothetical protein A2902_02275 [Elusimicrobia bacterium RIFCSPLOWO2_01_FULL_64_13]|nr:MAG: hypothetical protein A2636_07150 [Elusimicrobia bacterium RIFCSPHIGHO2_01_FULL_64_10]OGR94377.1 MAG: hypothetical protein A2902_02275 [Elusimicrobia bacterium RIFCSPLOWO2_01_FULL_64_13]
MAQPFSSRDDIKRDVFQDSMKKALDWISRRRQTFFSIVGTAAVAAVVGVFVAANFRSLKKQAWERYSAGQNWAYAGDAAKAMGLFDDVLANFARTPAASYTLLAKADLLYNQKRFADAARAYRDCLSRDLPKAIRPYALAGLGCAQEDQGDFPGAVESYRQFTASYPDHILSPKIYESLGRVYELSMNLEAAKESYEKIITMFPGTFWSERARVRYQILAPQPFQSSPG